MVRPVSQSRNEPKARRVIGHRRREQRQPLRRRPACILDLLTLHFFHSQVLRDLRDIRDILSMARVSPLNMAEKFENVQHLDIRGGHLNIGTFMEPSRNIPWSFYHNLCSLHLVNVELPRGNLDLIDLGRTFPNVSSLTISQISGIVEIDLGVYEHLHLLAVSKNPDLQKITLPRNLRSLAASDSPRLRTVENCENLRMLLLNGCRSLPVDHHLNLANMHKLEMLECRECELKTVDLAGLKNLWIFDCSQNHLEMLDISDSQEIEELHCRDNHLSKIKLPVQDRFAFGVLKVLDASGNLLKRIPNCTRFMEMTSIDLSRNLLEGVLTDTRLPFTSEDLSLNVSGNSRLEAVDVSLCWELHDLKCNDCPRIKSILVNEELKSLECRNTAVRLLNLSLNRRLEHLDAAFIRRRRYRIRLHPNVENMDHFRMWHDPLARVELAQNVPLEDSDEEEEL